MTKPNDPKELDLSDYMSPDYGTMGQRVSTFFPGLGKNTSPGIARDFDVFSALVGLIEDKYAPERIDDGISGSRLAKIAHYEILPAEDVTDPVLELLNSSSPPEQEIAEVFVVYAAVAGGTSSMLTPPKSPEDWSRIYRLPRFYSLLPDDMSEKAAWVGQQCWVEFLDKDLHAYGLFKGMTNGSTSMFESGQRTNLRPGQTDPKSLQHLFVNLDPNNPIATHSGFPVTPVPPGFSGQMSPPETISPIMRRHEFVQKKAAEIGLNWHVALAFMEIESGHLAFKTTNPDQRCNIAVRFEPHVFAKELYKKNLHHKLINNARGWFVDPPCGNAKRCGGSWSRALIDNWKARGFRHGQRNDADFNSLMYAATIDEEIAFRSASYGLPQVMGFHHKTMGYRSAKEMFIAYSQSERAQILGFFNFIVRVRGGKCLRALREGRYLDAIHTYNGVRNVKYLTKMNRALSRYSAGKLPTNLPLRESKPVSTAIA